MLYVSLVGRSKAFPTSADGANGYLIHRFLSPTINLRADGYGGKGRRPFHTNARDRHGDFRDHAALRIGLRLSPFADHNSTRDPKPEDTYGPLAHWLQTAGFAYLHLADTNARTGAPDSQRGKSRPSAKHRS